MCVCVMNIVSFVTRKQYLFIKGFQVRDHVLLPQGFILIPAKKQMRLKFLSVTLTSLCGLQSLNGIIQSVFESTLPCQGSIHTPVGVSYCLIIAYGEEEKKSTSRAKMLGKKNLHFNKENSDPYHGVIYNILNLV